MTQPLSVTTDLQRYREHREYVNADGDSRRGRLWFRNCHTGCTFMEIAKATGDDVLTQACRECALLPGMSAEADRVLRTWHLPDSALGVSAATPYWYVNGLATARAQFGARGF